MIISWYSSANPNQSESLFILIVFVFSSNLIGVFELFVGAENKWGHGIGRHSTDDAAAIDEYQFVTPFCSVVLEMLDCYR